MRSPRKRPAGWRSLRVGALDVWWTVGTPRVVAREERVQSIELTITVMQAGGEGRKLVATVRGQRALAVPAAGFADVQTLSVTPAAVRRLVESAAPDGVWPEGTGVSRVQVDVKSAALPEDLSFRPEHLDALQLVWSREP